MTTEEHLKQLMTERKPMTDTQIHDLGQDSVYRRALALTLSNLREQHGYSREQLTAEDITVEDISAMERGERDPLLGTLLRLAERLQISLAVLTAEIERNAADFNLSRIRKMEGFEFEPRLSTMFWAAGRFRIPLSELAEEIERQLNKLSQGRQ